LDSDDDSDNGGKDENLAPAASTAPSFKPAWENDNDESDESDNDEIDAKAKELASSEHVSSAAPPSKSAAASTTGSEPAVKKKKLPSALDALNTATTTFLAAQQPEPDGEESAARAGAVADVALASGTANTTQQANDSRLKTPSSAPSLVIHLLCMFFAFWTFSLYVVRPFREQHQDLRLFGHLIGVAVRVMIPFDVIFIHSRTDFLSFVFPSLILSRPHIFIIL
jgi:hypothetical protein